MHKDAGCASMKHIAKKKTHLYWNILETQQQKMSFIEK